MFKIFSICRLNKYLKCSVWRLALRYDIYIYIYISLGFKRLIYDETKTKAEYILSHKFMQRNTNQWGKKMELESSSEMHFLATNSEATVILQYILCLQATANDTMFHSIRTPPKKEQTSSFVHSVFGNNK